MHSKYTIINTEYKWNSYSTYPNKFIFHANGILNTCNLMLLMFIFLQGCVFLSLKEEKHILGGKLARHIPLAIYNMNIDCVDKVWILLAFILS